MKKIKYLILLAPFLSGCYNYRELNDLGITTAISIDFDDEFKVITQLVNPVKQQDVSSSGEPSFVNYEAKGETIQDAFRHVILESPRQLNGSHLEILILSENVASNKLGEVLDFFMRDPEIRSEVKVIIAQNTEDLKGITVQSLLSDLSSSKILESLEVQSKREGIASVATINDLTNMYLNPYLEIVLPSTIVEGNIQEGEEKENINTTKADAIAKIAPTAVFKDNKFLGYLTYEEAIYLNFIRGEIKDTIVSLDYEEGKIVFEPNRIKTKVEADVKNNKIIVSIKGFSRINAVSSLIDLEDPKTIEKLQIFLNKKVEEKIMETFTNIRDKYQSDIFGFRDLYYKTNVKYFEKNYQNWYDDVFPNLKMKVKSNIEIYEKGSILGGINYERKNK